MYVHKYIGNARFGYFQFNSTHTRVRIHLHTCTHHDDAICIRIMMLLVHDLVLRYAQTVGHAAAWAGHGLQASLTKILAK